MDLVDQLRAFVATAQTGSFTAAADQLRVSNRLTSKYVGELEARLGVRLFQRTTRKVGLTPAGSQLLARAPAVLDELDDVLAGVSAGSRGTSGIIRIAAPVTFGETYVAGMLGRFGAKYPDLVLDLRLSDRHVDLASDGIDLAFRIGVTETLSVKTVKLGTTELQAAASPTYLDACGVPEVPGDLTAHTCIIDTNGRSPKRWTFSRGGQDFNIPIAGRYLVNSARAACDLATAGHGITCSPRFALSSALNAGRLSLLLQDYGGETIPFTAVYLEGRTLPRKVRSLIDFAKDDIRDQSAI
ncbi:MAG: LysR family transcriptional regulator [Pseudomonadota bacterium]